MSFSIHNFGTAIAISSTFAIVINGNMEKDFANKGESPHAILVVLGDGIEHIVDSSLSCEESERVLIWDCQHDSCLSVSGRVALLAYFGIPGWHIGGRLQAVTYELVSRLAATLLGDVIQSLETYPAGR